MDEFIELCKKVQIIPVLVIEDIKNSLPLADALAEGGLTVLEVTLRTDAAWEAVEMILQNRPDVTIGVGSVLQKSDMLKAKDMGLHFAVSPGLTLELLTTAKNIGLPYLPGVATVTEILTAREQGYTFLKFFPAGLNGGVKALKAFGGPVQDVQFCPTGGVSPENIKDYLSCENVPCVGGSWLVTKEDERDKDWQGVRARVRQAKGYVHHCTS